MTPKSQNILFTIPFLLILTNCNQRTNDIADILPNKVIPNHNQILYQQMEMVGFIHFTVNTFTDKEWGFGDEDPAIFNPTDLNTEQWVLTAKEGGLNELILTAKHHDGFCLWPSAYTEHSVKNSPYKSGHGDIMREFTEACRKHGLKAGIYLSPWDRNHEDYGNPEYIKYYRDQLRELLTNYGEITEIWFDGANGGTGYYGGANEERQVDKKTYYDWETTFALVKELQPDILIFSDAGPDIRWVGNEKGHAGRTFWSTISNKNLVIGGSDADYLNKGDPDGNIWLIGQCDVSIRPGWFFHHSQDNKVKTPEEILDIYYKSVGRNGVLLLNLPPDRRGLIHETDVTNLMEFKKIIDRTFTNNLSRSENTRVTASNQRQKHPYFSPANIVDGNPESYWAADDGYRSAELILELKEKHSFDRISIQEPIQFGQRISKFRVFIENSSGEWEKVAEETTIGYKRLLRVPVTETKRIKLVIDASNSVPAISEFGIFWAGKNGNGIL